VEDDGYVCYVQDEGLVVDRHNPAGLILDALARAEHTLGQGVRGENRLDFMDEFGAYWRRIGNKETVTAFIQADDRLREVIAIETQKAGLVLADKVDDISGFLNGNILKGVTQRRALYVPLVPGSFVQPPRRGDFWTAKQIQQIVQTNLNPHYLGRLKHLSRKTKDEEVVILGLPRPKGGMTLVGIKYQGARGRHPLWEGEPLKPPQPLWVERCDTNYLLARSGAHPDFLKKRVLVIGCGSVGGFVAMSLAGMGVGQITLLDSDSMKYENIFRHVLGKAHAGKPKVEGLKSEIEQKYPYVRVEGINSSIETALGQGKMGLLAFDLIIVALGMPTLELTINERLHSNPESPPAIFTWLEPLGIGGHALLTRGSSQGCLECLYTPTHAGESNLFNRASFAEKDQFFGKDLLGCGTTFTPFGTLDAQRTAELASRLAANALLGLEPDNSLVSWKGNPTDFLNNGFATSQRFQQAEDELFSKRLAYIQPGCAVCGAK